MQAMTSSTENFKVYDGASGTDMRTDACRHACGHACRYVYGHAHRHACRHTCRRARRHVYGHGYGPSVRIMCADIPGEVATNKRHCTLHFEVKVGADTQSLPTGPQNALLPRTRDRCRLEMATGRGDAAGRLRSREGPTCKSVLGLLDPAASAADLRQAKIASVSPR